MLYCNPGAFDIKSREESGIQNSWKTRHVNHLSRDSVPVHGSSRGSMLFASLAILFTLLSTELYILIKGTRYTVIEFTRGKNNV